MGIATINLPAFSVLDELIGNNAGSTGRQTATNLGAQLLAQPQFSDWLLSITGEPIVILATGQSNIANNELFDWVPPANLKYWNATSGSAGTTISAAPNDHMRVSYSFAAEIARKNPERLVYIINIGLGSTPISHWMTGTGATDMYAACKAAVEAFLAAAPGGLTKIDHLLWWQGESDAFANSVTYAEDFETVWFRFVAEDWFPRTTPVTIMAVSERDTDATEYSKLVPFNRQLKRVVDHETMFRTFVDTRLLSADCWELPISGNLHMTGDGYRQAGIVAYMAAFEGYGRGRNATPWETAYKRATETRSSLNTPAIDLNLKIALRNGFVYRVRMRVFGQTGATADFKWSITGPTATLVHGVADWLANDAPNTRHPQYFQAGYPSGQTVTVGTNGTNFMIEVEFIVAPTTDDGDLQFNWSQNTSDAGLTYVFAGSAIEIIEVV